MNTNDYNSAWEKCPVMSPMFVMTHDVTRGGKVHKKGTVLYAQDNSKTFVVPGEGNIGLPLAAVKFVGYGDANQIFRDTFG